MKSVAASRSASSRSPAIRGKPSPRSTRRATRSTGQIKSITDFGIFIGLDGGIDGLIHLSDISWNSTGEDIARNYKKGDTLEAVVLAVDPERERISLGVKQMEQDPIGQFVATNPGARSSRAR